MKGSKECYENNTAQPKACKCPCSTSHFSPCCLSQCHFVVWERGPPHPPTPTSPSVYWTLSFNVSGIMRYKSGHHHRHNHHCISLLYFITVFHFTELWLGFSTITKLHPSQSLACPHSVLSDNFLTYLPDWQPPWWQWTPALWPALPPGCSGMTRLVSAPHSRSQHPVGGQNYVDLFNSNWAVSREVLEDKQCWICLAQSHFQWGIGGQMLLDLLNSNWAVSREVLEDKYCWTGLALSWFQWGIGGQMLLDLFNSNWVDSRKVLEDTCCWTCLTVTELIPENYWRTHVAGLV